jgi:hypothetical protein
MRGDKTRKGRHQKKRELGKWQKQRSAEHKPSKNKLQSRIGGMAAQGWDVHRIAKTLGVPEHIVQPVLDERRRAA